MNSRTSPVNGPHALVLAPVLVPIRNIAPVRPATVRVLNLSRRSCFAEFTGAWDWFCQEKTKRGRVRSCRLSVLALESKSAYRDVFARQFAP
jgi:hypothetical protein